MVNYEEFMKIKFKKGKDYKTAIKNAKVFLISLKEEFGDSIKGISIGGSVSGCYYMKPINVDGLTEATVKKIREAGLPIQGESRGSDIDALLFISKDKIREIAVKLSERINVLADDARIEHIVLVPFEDAINIFKQMKELLENVVKKDSNIDFLKSRANVYFVFSTRAKKHFIVWPPKWKHEKINENVFQISRSWRALSAAYRSINLGVPRKLKRLLNTTRKVKQLIFRLEIKTMIEDGRLDTYLKKRQRFKFLKEILKE